MDKKVAWAILVSFLIPFTIQAEWVSLAKKTVAPIPPKVILISDDSSIDIDLRKHPKGPYFIKIRTDNLGKTRKVVLK